MIVVVANVGIQGKHQAPVHAHTGLTGCTHFGHDHNFSVLATVCPVNTYPVHMTVLHCV
jgi:hypothetical protein